MIMLGRNNMSLYNIIQYHPENTIEDLKQNHFEQRINTFKGARNHSALNEMKRIGL